MGRVLQLQTEPKSLPRENTLGCICHHFRPDLGCLHHGACRCGRRQCQAGTGCDAGFGTREKLGPSGRMGHGEHQGQATTES